MSGGHLDLLYAILDLQLVDSRDVRCGRVDDIVLADDGRIDHLLAGPAVWPRRLPRRLRPWADRAAAALAPDPVRIPWDAVERIGPYVHLSRTADELDLARGDRELRWLLGKMPWAQTRRHPPT